ncbi:hypothetical protein WJX74_006036 [Apatococcus lobatus]|uniref:Uncharacterized protein n=1 Tax=Apatococcus lobatus TaxID=904363 RepID=A0AAW1QKA4_9CHLO
MVGKENRSQNSPQRRASDDSSLRRKGKASGSPQTVTSRLQAAGSPITKQSPRAPQQSQQQQQRHQPQHRQAPASGLSSAIIAGSPITQQQDHRPPAQLQNHTQQQQQQQQQQWHDSQNWLYSGPHSHAADLQTQHQQPMYDQQAAHVENPPNTSQAHLMNQPCAERMDTNSVLGHSSPNTHGQPGSHPSAGPPTRHPSPHKSIHNHGATEPSMPHEFDVTQHEQQDSQPGGIGNAASVSAEGKDILRASLTFPRTPSKAAPLGRQPPVTPGFKIRPAHTAPASRAHDTASPSAAVQKPSAAAILNGTVMSNQSCGQPPALSLPSAQQSSSPHSYPIMMQSAGSQSEGLQYHAEGQSEGRGQMSAIKQSVQGSSEWKLQGSMSTVVPQAPYGTWMVGGGPFSQPPSPDEAPQPWKLPQQLQPSTGAASPPSFNAAHSQHATPAASAAASTGMSQHQQLSAVQPSGAPRYAAGSAASPAATPNPSSPATNTYTEPRLEQGHYSPSPITAASGLPSPGGSHLSSDTNTLRSPQPAISPVLSYNGPAAHQSSHWPGAGIASGQPSPHHGGPAGSLQQSQQQLPQQVLQSQQGSPTDWQAVLAEAGTARSSAHGDLLGTIMPSADEGRTHALVAQLRAALRTAELSASSSQQQLAGLKQHTTAIEAEVLRLGSEVEQAQARITFLAQHPSGSSALSSPQAAMLEEIQRGMAEWRGQALAAAQAEAAARDALAAVEGQLASSQQAAAEERERLGMEAAQCRLLCRARARQVSQLEQDLAELQGSQAAAQEASHSNREDADRSVADALLRLDAAEAAQAAAQEACNAAQEQASEAAKEREWAQAQQAAAEAGLQDARLHMDWQDMRIADLEGRDVSQMASRLDSELQNVRGALQAQVQDLTAQLVASQQQCSDLKAAAAEGANLPHSTSRTVSQTSHRPDQQQSGEASASDAQPQHAQQPHHQQSLQIAEETTIASQGSNASWRDALGLDSDSDAEHPPSSALEETEEELRWHRPSGLEQQEAGKILAGQRPRTGGGLRDGLIAAAHQEILRLKEVNERLLQAQSESHKRVPSEAVEAAVAAASQQAEKVLAECNACWMERANALETEAQQAQRRIVELEAAADPLVSMQGSAEARTKLQHLQGNLDKADRECERWRSECNSVRQSSVVLQRQLLERTEALNASQSELEQLQLEVEAEAAMAALEAGSREAAAAQRLGALQQQLHEAQAALQEGTGREIQLGHELAVLRTSHASLQAQHAGLHSLQSSITLPRNIAPSQPAPTQPSAEASAREPPEETTHPQLEQQQQQQHLAQAACHANEHKPGGPLPLPHLGSDLTSTSAAPIDATNPGGWNSKAPTDTDAIAAVMSGSTPRVSSEPSDSAPAGAGRGGCSPCKGSQEISGEEKLAEAAPASTGHYEAGDPASQPPDGSASAGQNEAGCLPSVPRHSSCSDDQPGCAGMQQEAPDRGALPPAGKSSSPQQAPSSRIKQLRADGGEGPASPAPSCPDSARSTVVDNPLFSMEGRDLAKALSSPPLAKLGISASHPGSSGHPVLANESPSKASSSAARDSNSQHGNYPSSSNQQASLLHRDEPRKVSPPPADFIRQAISPRHKQSQDMALGSTAGSSPMRPSSRQQQQQQHQQSSRQAPCGQSARKGGLLHVRQTVEGLESDADDDMCCMSSVRDTPASSVATSRPSQGAGRVPVRVASAQGKVLGARGSRTLPAAAKNVPVAAPGPHDGIPIAGPSTSPPLPKPRGVKAAATSHRYVPSSPSGTQASSRTPQQDARLGAAGGTPSPPQQQQRSPASEYTLQAIFTAWHASRPSLSNRQDAHGASKQSAMAGGPNMILSMPYDRRLPGGHALQNDTKVHAVAERRQREIHHRPARRSSSQDENLAAAANRSHEQALHGPGNKRSSRARGIVSTRRPAAGSPDHFSSAAKPVSTPQRQAQHSRQAVPLDGSRRIRIAQMQHPQHMLIADYPGDQAEASSSGSQASWSAAEMLSDHTSHARLEAGRTSGHISVNGDYESMGPHQPPSAAEKLLQRPNASPDYKHHTGRAHDAAAEDSQALAAERTSEWVQDVSSEASGYATDWAEEFAGLTPTSVQTPHAATAGQASGHMHSKLQPQHHSAAKAHQQTPGHLPHGGKHGELRRQRADGQSDQNHTSKSRRVGAAGSAAHQAATPSRPADPGDAALEPGRMQCKDPESAAGNLKTGTHRLPDDASRKVSFPAGCTPCQDRPAADLGSCPDSSAMSWGPAELSTPTQPISQVNSAGFSTPAQPIPAADPAGAYSSLHSLADIGRRLSALRIGRERVTRDGSSPLHSSSPAGMPETFGRSQQTMPSGTKLNTASRTCTVDTDHARGTCDHDLTRSARLWHGRPQLESPPGKLTQDSRARIYGRSGKSTGDVAGPNLTRQGTTADKDQPSRDAQHSHRPALGGAGIGPPYRKLLRKPSSRGEGRARPDFNASSSPGHKPLKDPKELSSASLGTSRHRTAASPAADTCMDGSPSRQSKQVSGVRSPLHPQPWSWRGSRHAHEASDAGRQSSSPSPRAASSEPSRSPFASLASSLTGSPARLKSWHARQGSSKLLGHAAAPVGPFSPSNVEAKRRHQADTASRAGTSGDHGAHRRGNQDISGETLHRLNSAKSAKPASQRLLPTRLSRMSQSTFESEQVLNAQHRGFLYCRATHGHDAAELATSLLEGDAQQLTNKRASHAHIVGSAAEHIFVSDEALPVSQYGHLDGTAARFYDAEESTGLRGNERDVWPANQSRVNDSLSRLQQVSQPLPKQQARADGSGADALQTSLYHRERSRLQEALAMQQARAALHVKRKGAVPGQAAAAHKAFLGPWDSAWDRAG